MTLHLGTLSSACGCEAVDDLPAPDVALARALALCTPVPGVEWLQISAAAGRVTSRETLAPGPLPRFDNAAMDGFALALDDLSGEGPWALPVVARIRAGEGAPRLAAGTAARILTGAPVPEGADVVIAQEDVDHRGEAIFIERRPAKGTHIRRQGEDVAIGATLLPAGRLIGAREAGALGAAGVTEVPVRRKVRVAILVTGAELGGKHRPGKIADANTPLLLAALAQPWIAIQPPQLLPDDPLVIADALAALAGRADLIVTTGGVSVGDEDHLRHAVRRAGGRVALSGIAMKPGKPLSFGRAGGAFWLGLPGNPVAAFTSWTVIGLHVAAALAGLAASPQRRIMARLAEPVRHAVGRCEFRPATLAGYGGDGAMVVRCLRGTGSHRAAQLAGAEALALIPAESEMLPAGALVEIILL